MQPYVIKQGDFLALLAHKFGFDADTVWNDPANADLRKLRPNPNILWPTDVLYIPEPSPPVTHTLVTGQTNTFVSTAPTTTMTIRFADTSLASQAFTVTELPDLTGKATTSDGTATFDLPVTLDSFTIVFTESGTTFAFTTGGLDPINTLSGVFQRLQNLGYLPRTGDARPLDIDEIRAALTAFKIAHAGAGPSATSASTDSSTSAAPDGGGPQTSASTAAPDADTNAPDDVSPSSSGLGDDGRLDDATSQQLLAAHGS